MIYGYIRTSRPAVDGLARMHPETQVRPLADAGVEPACIVSDVGISGSVPVGERPRSTGLVVLGGRPCCPRGATVQSRLALVGRLVWPLG